jgi:hypothetical protein
MTRTPAAASRMCPARASRTWTQIITERPAGRTAYPETPGNPAPEEKHHTRIIRGAELPVDSHAQDVAVETATAVQVARAQEDPPAQNIHATIPASR